MRSMTRRSTYTRILTGFAPSYPVSCVIQWISSRKTITTTRAISRAGQLKQPSPALARHLGQSHARSTHPRGLVTLRLRCHRRCRDQVRKLQEPLAAGEFHEPTALADSAAHIDDDKLRSRRLVQPLAPGQLAGGASNEPAQRRVPPRQDAIASGLRRSVAMIARAALNNRKLTLRR